MFRISKYNTETTPDGGSATNDGDKYSDMFLKPRVSIRTSDLLEIAPYIGIGFDNHNDISTVTEDTETKEVTVTTKQFIFGAGVGAYFHVIDADWFGLSTGPRINWKTIGEPKKESSVADYKAPEYETYKNMEIGVDVPLNLDFTVNDKFGFRLGTSLFDFTVTSKTEQYKVEGETKDDEEKYTSAKVRFLGETKSISAGIFFNL